MKRRKMYVPIMNRNKKTILIKLFKNGYIVENEPFCRNDDSDSHKVFFQSIVDGYVPRELEREVRLEGKKVVVEDHRTETYVPPPSRFYGKANKMRPSMYELMLGIDCRKLPIKRETKLSNKRNLYDKGKPKAGIKIELANHDSMILEITEDWDNEDLYAAIQQRSNESSWELQGGLRLQPIECNHTKIFKAGYGGMPIIQVRR